MAKHRRMSERSKRARTVIGGLAAGGALAAVAPAGLAMADDNPDAGTKVDADTPAYAVGRDNLHNPAPGLRVIQTVGDQVFNDSTDINKALNGSPLGTGYHSAFGSQGDLVWTDTDDDGYGDTYRYTVGSGKEGAFKGVLNTTPGNVIGNAVPVRECNFVNDSSNLAPKVSIRAQCTSSKK